MLRAITSKTDKHISVTVTGSSYSIAEVGEELAWINAVFTPPYLDDVVASISPSCDISKVPHGTQSTTRVSKICRLVASRTTPATFSSLADSNGTCWKNLFRNPVLVQGYPIPRRQYPNTGIEAPLDVIAHLVNTPKVSIFNNMIFLKAHSTVLVPTLQHQGVIYWHMVFDKDGNHVSYSDSKVKSYLANYPKDLSISDLQTFRHVVGWCPNVVNCTGKQ